MARINVEDSLWSDLRFQELMIKVGNRHTAKGMVVELWTEAQKFWLSSGGKGIPKTTWDKLGLPSTLIDVGLAEDRGEFIYAIGSKEKFSWLNANSENGKKGGPAAAKTRVEIKGKSKRPKSSKHDESNPDTSSYSSSSSFSFSSSDSSSGVTAEIVADAKAPRKPAKSAAVWEAYSEAYEQRFHNRPADNKSERINLCRLIDLIGEKDAPEVARFYLRHPNAFYINAGYPTSLLARDAQKLRTEWMAGRVITTQKAREVERRYSTAEAFGLLDDEKDKKKHG